MPQPWAIYARISRVHRADGQLDTLGVERQQPPAEKLVADRGGHVAKVFIDNDTSAYGGKYREDYETMLSWAQEGRIVGIAAWAADRLTRQPLENERLIELAERYGIQLATATGDHDLSTPAGRLHFRMLGSIARYESEHRAERLRLKYAQLAESGAPKGGGIRPFGFQPDRCTHNAKEAATLQEAAARLLAGETSYAVLWDFKDRGVTGSTGRPITVTTLRRALLAPRTAGQRQHRGVVLGPAAWEPIISPEDQARLAALFSGRDRQALGAPPRTLLSGIARCTCGNPLVSGHSRSRGAYVCQRRFGNTACGKTSILREPLDALITERVLNRLAGPGLARMLKALAGDDPDHAAIAAEIEADETALAELERDRYQRRDASGRPLVSPETYPRLRDEIQARIDAARRRQKPRPEARVLMELPKVAGKLRQAWSDDFDLEQKRAIIRACLVDLVIKPARPGAPRRFDHHRVKPEWRDQAAP